ncbi:MAG: class I SAM-dependent DNA methyltransferase [Candidatus Hodarchaeota archaeon]
MKKGQIYTPLTIANLVTELVLADKILKLQKALHPDNFDEREFNQIINEFNQLSVLDPACGEAIFLISVYSYLKKELSNILTWEDLNAPKKDELSGIIENIKHKIYGVDVNPIAIKNARNKVHRDLAISHSVISRQICVADFLDDSISDVFNKWKQPNFSIIIGNPPFIDVFNLLKSQKNQLRSKFRTLSKRFDLYIPFLEQAINFLSPNGTIAFILPSSMLYESYASKIRKVILEKLRIKRIYDISKFNVFPAAIRTIFLILERQKDGLSNHVEVFQPLTNPLGTMQLEYNSFFIPQSFFYRTYDNQFRLIEEKTREIGEKIRSRSIKLGTIFVTAWGARGTPIKDFHITQPINDKCKPLIKGEDIIPYPFPHVH